MIGKVKRWLGIEGVKLELVVPEEIEKESGRIKGKIRLHSKADQRVKYIRVHLIERYSRGKKDEKRIDEYVLGELFINKSIPIDKDKVLEIPFELPFELLQSNMDSFEEKNFLAKGLVSVAKWWSSVKSEFRIEAEAKVEGTALDPFDRKKVVMK